MSACTFLPDEPLIMLWGQMARPLQICLLKGTVITVNVWTGVSEETI